MADALEVFRGVTAIAAVVAAGANAYVCYIAWKLNRKAEHVVAAWSYPGLAALTCFAIFVGRSVGLLAGEAGLQTTDVSAPIVVALALYAGWTSTGRLADIDEKQEIDGTRGWLHDLVVTLDEQEQERKDG